MQRIFFYLVCGFIAYGSLYPFEFSLQISQESIAGFLDSWWPSSSIGDVLGNIALFVPFGFLGFKLRPYWGLILMSVLLTVGLQIAQLFLPSRSPAMYDVFWNMTGMAIGFMCAHLLKPATLFNDRQLFTENAAVIALLMLWVAFQLIPFVPTLDWQSYKNALKPLIFFPTFVFSDIVYLTVAWSVVGCFSEKVLGKWWRDMYLLPEILLILALKIVIVTNQLTLSDLIAGITAAAIYRLTRQINNRHTSLLAWLMLFGYAVSSLSPFQILSEVKPFVWLPFSGFLDGSMVVNSSVLCEKLFVFGSIFFLLKGAKLFHPLTATVVFGVVGLIELCQMWIIGRTAEITDPLLVILMACLVAHIKSKTLIQPIAQEVPPIVQAAARILQAHFLSQSSEKRWHQSNEKTDILGDRRNVFIVGLVACITIAVVFYLIIRLPNVPYNVRELFKYGGTGIDLFIFGLALLAMGAAPAWMGYKLANARQAVIEGPRAAIIVSVVIYTLFFASVTEESIMDIAGSSVVVHRVGEKGVLGEIGIDFVAAIGAKNLYSVTRIFEPIVRLGALFGPLIIFQGLIFASLFHSQSISGAKCSGALWLFCRQLFINMIYMMPWLFFCKVIAFDWSSTDNLNELIARDGYYGIGGGGYLYILVGLIALLAGNLAWAFVNRSGITIMMLMVVCLVSVLFGWQLINAGLADNVGKYGLKFSGVDFLLGPDRSHLLSKKELFLRWALCQFSATLGLAFGAMLYLKWIGQCRDSQTSIGRGRPSINGNVLSGLRIPIDLNQVEFLNALSVRRNESFSETLESIIAFLKYEIENFANVQKMVYGEIKSLEDSHDTSVVCSVFLHPVQMKFITQIQVDSEVAISQVVNVLIKVFMATSSFSVETDAKNIEAY